MGKYVFPLVVCAAIGGLVVLFVKAANAPAEPDRPEPVAEESAPEPRETERRPGLPDPRDTPTGVDENRWLSELERSLQREDLSHARYFRQRLCADISGVLEKEKLRNNLFKAIREHGIESDDLKRRDVVLPMLRTIPHPEATRMIEEAYYTAKNEQERVMLIEAMSHEYHAPGTAAVWAIERALNSDSEERRHRVFEVLERFSNDPKLVVDTALQIYASTTRPPQREQMLDAVATRGQHVEEAREFIRRKLRNPHPDEIMALTNYMEGWATEQDAAYLESLAEDYPGMGNFLRQRANQVREARRTLDREKRMEEIEKLPPAERERILEEMKRAEDERAKRDQKRLDELAEEADRRRKEEEERRRKEQEGG